MFERKGNFLVVEMGYVVRCVSWENDGDYYNTKEKVYPSKEVAEAVMSVVCAYEGAYGNQCDMYGEREKHIVKYDIAQLATYLQWAGCDSDELEKILSALTKRGNGVPLTDEDDENISNADEWVSNDVYDLMGGSEYYRCRVIDTIELLHVKERVEIEVVATKYSSRR